MYDRSLEQLIDAVIADGVITDQERRVVYKKAASLGIDQDEIEVYLQGRLDAFKKTNGPKSGKYGVVKTCPNCGATVEAGSAKCRECGYAFTGIEANSSAKLLDERLRAVKTTNNPISSVFGSALGFGESKERANIISSFPIPNSREDLIEFLQFIEPKITPNPPSNSQAEAQAYKEKFKECLNKLKDSFPDDPMVNRYKKRLHKRNFSKMIPAIISIIFLVLIFGGCFYFVSREIGKSEKITQELIEKIDQLPVPNTTNYIECYRALQKIHWTEDISSKSDSAQYNAFMEARAGYASLLKAAFKSAGVPETDIPSDISDNIMEK